MALAGLRPVVGKRKPDRPRQAGADAALSAQTLDPPLESAAKGPVGKARSRWAGARWRATQYDNPLLDGMLTALELAAGLGSPTRLDVHGGVRDETLIAGIDGERTVSPFRPRCR